MPEPIPRALEERALEVFTTAIEEMGGPSGLLERHEQEILPALAQSSYIVVLGQEGHKSVAEIARALDLAEGVVQSVFEAPLESHEQRIRYRTDEWAEFTRHQDPEWSGQPMTNRVDDEFLVGALAKYAYGVVKRKAGLHT